MEEQKTTTLKTEKAKDLPLVKEGDYVAEITDIETDQEGRFGKMLVFHFDVNGVEVSALCSQKLNPKTKLFDWVRVLTGNKLLEGQDLVIQELIGKKALVTVRNRIVKDENGIAKTEPNGKPVLTSSINEIREIPD